MNKFSETVVRCECGKKADRMCAICGRSICTDGGSYLRREFPFNIEFRNLFACGYCISLIRSGDLAKVFV